jgi:hypothetical protein
VFVGHSPVVVEIRQRAAEVLGVFALEGQDLPLQELADALYRRLDRLRDGELRVGYRSGTGTHSPKTDREGYKSDVGTIVYQLRSSIRYVQFQIDEH